MAVAGQPQQQASSHRRSLREEDRALAVLMMVGLFVTAPILIWLLVLGGLWLSRVLS